MITKSKQWSKLEHTRTNKNTLEQMEHMRQRRTPYNTQEQVQTNPNTLKHILEYVRAARDTSENT